MNRCPFSVLTVLGLSAFAVPCDPQGGPAEEIVPPPRRPACLLERPLWFWRPGVSGDDSADGLGTSVWTEITPVPSVCSLLSTLLGAQMWSPQAQGGVRPGVQAGREGGGLASPRRRRPGDRLQASWLRPSPSGRPASPRPLPLPSSPASRTSVLTGSEAPSPSGPTEDCSPGAVSPLALVLSSGSQTSGPLGSEFPPGSGASSPGPHPCPLPSSCPSWHPVPDGHSHRASKGPA